MNLIIDDPDFDIRYSKGEDLPFLQKWIRHPDSKKWFPVSTDQDIEDMTQNWIGFHQFGASLTADYKKEPVGIATLFLMPYRKLIHHALLYLIVNPDYWRRGIGTSLVKNINHLGKTYFRFEKLHLETYEGCTVFPLLKKMGYREIVRQEKFVKEGEGKYLARIIMEVQLKGAV